MKKPKSFNVWDWIVTKKGEVIQINHDDMMDLKYEDIKRSATPQEIKNQKRKNAILKNKPNLNPNNTH